MNNPPASRLLIVSNRLPIKYARKDGKTSFTESDGGLVSALQSYFRRSPESDFREVYWIGVADFPESRWVRFPHKAGLSSTYRIDPIFVDEEVYDKYYNGYSNATLWPLFHYFPSFTDFDEQTFKFYEEVNLIFRDRILELARPGDVVWVHDYHLLLLPGMLRKAMPELTIGFFLHIPFPTYEVFRLLHRRAKLQMIEGMLGADLIGFHTHEYLQHFLKTVRMVVGSDNRYREIIHRNRLVKADVFPLGIDFDRFNQPATNGQTEAHYRSIKERFGSSKIIFSVDRLDYTKGVTHRLSGFEKFLELFPEWKGKVTFIMVVVPSRQIVSKYNERRKMIEEQVGRINGKYSTLEWQPIIYRYSSLSFEELCALYQAADVALITPLRDGMNLVAKEFVASRQDGDGVLILSELAGAASELGEALQVNPTDKTEVASTIHLALMLDVDEQRRKMLPMQRRLKKNNVVAWVSEFFAALKSMELRRHEIQMRLLDDVARTQLLEEFNNADKRILFLDYDGTLVPIFETPVMASPDVRLLDLLTQLSSKPSTEVVIISGRNYKILEAWLGSLPVHLVAEHGASMRLKGREWQHFTDLNNSWKEMIRTTFQLFCDRCPGSFIEEKDHTIAWHYRMVDAELGFLRSRELLDNLFHLIHNTHLNVLDGHKVLEVRAAGFDKGIATNRILEEFPGHYVVAMGDDKTDEDIFRTLKGKAFTCKVGTGLTAASFNLMNQQDAFRLLEQLASEDSLIPSQPRS